VVGNLADRYSADRSLAAVCAAFCAVSLWLFPLAAAPLQPLLGLANGAGFAGAVTVANLLVVERHPKSEWNPRLGWLETALSVGQGCGLVLAAWLSGLSARSGLLIAALVPAAAIRQRPGRARRLGRRRVRGGPVGLPGRARHRRRAVLAGLCVFAVRVLPARARI
jgi:MFS family permease